MNKFLHYQGMKQLPNSRGGAFVVKMLLVAIFALSATQLSFATDSDASAMQAPATKGQISGRVVDKDGFPIIGATVIVKERPQIGTTTDVDGKYSLPAKGEETLVFSFIGFQSMEYNAREINGVAVTLQEDAMAVEEVVVVAFGKQKKESVVSSISTVSPKDLVVPSSNLTTAFAGKLPGVIAYQRSGEPGLDNADFFIRGVTTFGTGKVDPLILIDGIEMTSADLARINPDDIASFSVMKDASSAALYGSRGANGVILVSTKEGTEEKVNVNVRVELSSSSNSELVALADPITYMELHNEAVRTRDAMVPLPYTSEKIYNTKLGKDPIYYPSVDWYDYMIKPRTFNQRVNANLSGGGKAVQYYIAANLQHDTGILKETEANSIENNINLLRFQLRSNVTIKLAPRTKAVVRAYGSFDDSHGPKQGGAQVFDLARNANPVRFLPYYPKDEANQYTNHILWGKSPDNNNPLAQVACGYKESKTSMMMSQIEVDHQFDKALKGLSLRGTFNIKRNAYYDLMRSYNPFYYSPVETSDGSYELYCYNPDTGTEYLNYEPGTKYVTSSIYAEARISYHREFAEKHDVTAMLVGSIRSETTTQGSSLQALLPVRNVSTSGRVAYGYDSRYFIEGNFGYNASERFDKAHRWGFFPSVGVGWVLSNEPFMERAKDVLTNLKFKATYGLVGNDQIGNITDRFFHLSQIALSTAGYTFGENFDHSVNGISITRYANTRVTWEVAKKLNVGIEIGLFDDFQLNADYFRERRENILQVRSDIPSTMGLVTTPSANVGVAQGEGFEAELKYQKAFNEHLQLIVNGNFTYASSKYLEYEEPDFSDAPWRSHIGQKLSQRYGYIAERLFIDDADVANSPLQSFGTYGPGDIKYKDINMDGMINSNDQVPIGYPTTPEVIYGFGFTLRAYNFDLSCFFQGSARSSFFIDPGAIQPFRNNGQTALLQAIADDHWSEDNRNLHAFWPRLSDYEVANNQQSSTWWLRDGSFLRLKSAEFGYSLPKKVVQKIGMKSLRVYVSGSNLFYISKFKMWDPEMAGDGLGYPLQRVFNVGLNVQF